jgi:lysophospholipase L1-like esterase/azurin
MNIATRVRLGFLALLLTTVVGCTPDPAIELNEGDHIVLIGNALADRMQHDGWLETYLQSELSGSDLVFRNQGFSGDRIDRRPRSVGFPSEDAYLELSSTNVLFVMFGYNESFYDDAPGYGQALTSWIDSTQAKTYSGDGPPRIVLFSPIAFENLNDPNLPDGSEHNRRLEAYTEVTKSVAEAKGVDFVDLFHPSLAAYQSSEEALTINGVHLNREGNRVVGRIAAEAILGWTPKEDEAKLETIRQAVVDKNWHWFNRYRATDGNDVWGGRSLLSFTNGQTNYDVLNHELEQLDVMTANRDKVVWAAARGRVITPDDSNVPPPVKVETNLGEEQLQDGESKTGTVKYATAEESMAAMKLPDGLEVNLFASEEMFPELVNPVQTAVDTKGRLWVASWATYPKWEPLKEMDDRLLILPDENRDGVADTVITFAKVHNPTGFEFWNGGVIVASVPNLLFLKDTDGDDVADVRIELMGGLGSADTHHSANGFTYGPDGFIYYQRGVFNVSNVETPWTNNQESDVSGMYRFNPRTHEFSFHADNSPNAHGTAFDYWGYHYATDATGGRAYQVVPSEDAPGAFQMRKLLQNTVRPVTSSGIISSSHLPPDMEGDFILLNVIAFLGIKQYDLKIDANTGFVNGTETDDLLDSSDLNFRPSDFEIGDDGALYVADWANAIIGHMQHNVRDPNRDHEHGRIYRITATGRPLTEHAEIDGAPIEALLKHLENPVNGVRYRARIELSERNTEEVIAAAKTWLAGFDPTSAKDAHHVLEGLWLHQQHNVKDRELLAKVLASPVAHARRSAERVQMLWDHDSSALVPALDRSPFDMTPEQLQAQFEGKSEDGLIVVGTVVEQMRYNRPNFAVTAGETVKIRFENHDFLPHNLMIVPPGQGEAVGAMAEAMGGAGFDKGFVPENAIIIMATDLLSHEAEQTIEFTAPMEPGVYDIICSFPGHRATMNGKMTVLARE